MAFHNVRLPEDVEKGARGGPGFKTTIITLSSGHEKRNIDWQRQRGTWDISYGIQYKEDFEKVIDFFYIRRGRAHSFRFKDWTDFEMDVTVLGTGDGVRTQFQLNKVYSDAGGSYSRLITRPVAGSLTVFFDGIAVSPSDYTFSLGVITFNTAPGSAVEVSASCEFDVPVRFDMDNLQVQAETFEAAEIPGINIIEVRE